MIDLIFLSNAVRVGASFVTRVNGDRGDIFETAVTNLFRPPIAWNERPSNLGAGRWKTETVASTLFDAREG